MTDPTHLVPQPRDATRKLTGSTRATVGAHRHRTSKVTPTPCGFSSNRSSDNASWPRNPPPSKRRVLGMQCNGVGLNRLETQPPLMFKSRGGIGTVREMMYARASTDGPKDISSQLSYYKSQLIVP